jgi:hypothetical protein
LKISLGIGGIAIVLGARVLTTSFTGGNETNHEVRSQPTAVLGAQQKEQDSSASSGNRLPVKDTAAIESQIPRSSKSSADAETVMQVVIATKPTDPAYDQMPAGRRERIIAAIELLRNGWPATLKLVPGKPEMREIWAADQKWTNIALPCVVSVDRQSYGRWVRRIFELLEAANVHVKPSPISELDTQRLTIGDFVRQLRLKSSSDYRVRSEVGELSEIVKRNELSFPIFTSDSFYLLPIPEETSVEHLFGGHQAILTLRAQTEESSETILQPITDLQKVSTAKFKSTPVIAPVAADVPGWTRSVTTGPGGALSVGVGDVIAAGQQIGEYGVGDVRLVVKSGYRGVLAGIERSLTGNPVARIQTGAVALLYPHPSRLDLWGPVVCYFNSGKPPKPIPGVTGAYSTSEPDMLDESAPLVIRLGLLAEQAAKIRVITLDVAPTVSVEESSDIDEAFKRGLVDHLMNLAGAPIP